MRMTPAEQAERERLVAAVERADKEADQLYEKYVRGADQAAAIALLVLAAFDAAHKGEG